MQETLELILQEIREVKTKVDTLEKKVDALEIKVDNLEEKFEQKLSALEEKFNQKLSALEENFNQKLSILEENFDKKLLLQEERYDKKLVSLEERLTKIIDEKIEKAISKQSKEIAAEFHNLFRYLDKRFKQIEEKLDEEILNNRLAHESYETRLCKIEAGQNYLEKRIVG